MTHAAYIFAGYGLTTAVLAGYAAWVVSRRRSLARVLGLDHGSQASSPE
jgi:heme exporter protein CcmD